jgi:hypothetical protein
MHAFFILIGLLHATVLSVIAFFVLFTASRAKGVLRTIGNVLGAWLFILAALALIGSVAAPMFGGGPMGFRMMGSHGHHWMQPRQPGVGQPPATAPASPPPVAPAKK